jgi:hypothetical protein
MDPVGHAPLVGQHQGGAASDDRERRERDALRPGACPSQRIDDRRAVEAASVLGSQTAKDLSLWQRGRIRP